MSGAEVPGNPQAKVWLLVDGGGGGLAEDGRERLSRVLGPQKWWRRDAEDPDTSFLLFPANHFVMDLSGPFLTLSCCFRGGPRSCVHSANVVYVRACK